MKYGVCRGVNDLKATYFGAAIFTEVYSFVSLWENDVRQSTIFLNTYVRHKMLTFLLSSSFSSILCFSFSRIEFRNLWVSGVHVALAVSNTIRSMHSHCEVLRTRYCLLKGLRGRAGLIVVFSVFLGFSLWQLFFQSSYSISSIQAACQTLLTANGKTTSRRKAYLSLQSILEERLDSHACFLCYN